MPARKHRPLPRLLTGAAVFALLISAMTLLTPGTVFAADSISVRDHTCPDDYDASNASIYDLAANCHGVGSGVTFTFAVDNTVLGTGLTDGSGSIATETVPNGSAQITEDTPSGYTSRAFCAVFQLSDSTAHVYNEYGNPAVLPVHDDDILDCDWYDIPAPQPTTVTINKHNCPAGYDVASADIYGLAQNCQDGGTDGIAFTLVTTGGGGYALSATTASSLATFQNVPAGPINISETYPAGYNSARAFCNQKSLTGDETGESEFPIDPTVGITVQNKSGYDVFCDWFDYNATTTTYATIDISARGCPQSFDATTADYDSISQSCTTQLSGVGFHARGSQNGGSGDQTTDQTGLATFANLPADSYEVTEDLPSGYDQSIVFCKTTNQQTGDNTDLAEAVVSGDNSVTAEVDANIVLYCEWYNASSQASPTPVPPTPTQPVVVTPTGPTPTQTASGPATLKLSVYACDPGYDVSKKDAKPATDCPKTADGIQFALAGKTAKTGNQPPGVATFSGITAGSYQLVETYPGGVSSAFVLDCSSNLRDLSTSPFFPLEQIGANGAIGISLLAGEQMACDWYNVPAGQSAVKITVYACQGSTVNSNACAPDASGIDLTLSPVNGGADLTQTTDDQGAATFNVAPGTYTLSESAGSWCFADSDAFNNDGNVVVPPTGEIDIKLYNCG